MIPFHQYQRYKLAELIVNKLKTQDRKYKILEVGANEHRNLERFYLMMKYPIWILNFLRNYWVILPLLKDATNMHFGENSFDFVVALDVLEHISQRKEMTF